MIFIALGEESCRRGREAFSPLVLLLLLLLPSSVVERKKVNLHHWKTVVGNDVCGMAIRSLTEEDRSLRLNRIRIPSEVLYLARRR